MIFVTSYPYISPKHIRVFDFFKKREDLTFVLPEVWKMKGGKVIMRPVVKPDLNIIPARTYFFHSHYFLVKGLLKGWMPKLKKVLRTMSHPGDVLYTAIEPNLLVTYLNARNAKKFGLKHVFFTWQNIEYHKRLSGLKLELTEGLIRKNLALSSGAVCGNLKALNILKPYLPIGFKTVVAPISGVDTEQFRPGIPSDFRGKYGLQNKIILTFAGALDNRKGIATIFTAFVNALNKEPQLHLVLIGTGPLEQFIADFIIKNNLGNKVIRYPWLANDKLPEIFSNSDIFLYPSEPYGGWEEQFGYSAAEGSASGLPVITTDSGSLPDLIVPNESGFLIQPKNPRELEEKILVLAADPELRRKMGECGRRFIIENFSHQVVAQKMENFLRSL